MLGRGKSEVEDHELNFNESCPMHLNKKLELTIDYQSEISKLSEIT
jgi:hypothetical protein